MKYFSILVIVLILSSCKPAIQKEKDNENPIVLSEVAFIEITDYHSSDTIKSITKQLSADQTPDFVNRWNTSKSNGLCKYLPEFKIAVTLKDGSTLNFRTIGKTIKANNDLCFNFEDSTYFNNLWEQALISQPNYP